MMQVIISTARYTIPFRSGRLFSNPRVLSRHHHLPLISKKKDKELSLRIQTSQSFHHRKRNMVLCSSIGPEPPLPSDSSPGSWKGWILGVIFTAILPFWINKLGPLLKFTKEVEAAVETADLVTNIIEKVAEEVEKVAEDIADDLPEGNKLKILATAVENVAKETVKDANLAEEFIDKVEEVEKEVESFLESTEMDRGSQRGSSHS